MSISVTVIVSVVAVIGAYLVGSVASAVVISRLMGLPDPRTDGSGNPGATNVLRLGGKKAAILTLLGDLLKGLLPVLIVGLLPNSSPYLLAAVGLAAFLGHLFPLWFRFQGGKGVATALGVILGLSWPAAACILITWLLVAFLFRYSSLAALVAALFSPVYMWYFTSPSSYVYVDLCLVAAALIFWRHRANIRKLLAGTESKIGRIS